MVIVCSQLNSRDDSIIEMKYLIKLRLTIELLKVKESKKVSIVLRILKLKWGFMLVMGWLMNKN